MIAALACGDDDGGSGGADAGGAGTGAGDSGSGGGRAGRGGAGGGSGHGGAGGLGGSGGASSSDGGSMLGPSASVRVVSLVPDVAFDAWGPDVNGQPVKLAEGLEYATPSDYFDAPVNRVTMYPIFVLWKQGEAPEEGKLFSQLLDDSHERVRIEVRELDAAEQRATIILEPQDPVDVDPAAALQYETLDETELDRGDASMLNLHVSYHLFGIGSGIVDAFAIEGQTCLHDGSTNVAQVLSVPAGMSTLAVYDTQTGADCGETDPLATLPIDGDAGDNLLVALYREGDDVKMLSAPIE